MSIMTTRKGRHIYIHTFPLVRHTKDENMEGARLPICLPQPVTFPNVAVGGFAPMRQINCAKRTQTQWKQNNILTEDEMGAGIYNKLTLSYFQFWVSHKVATVPASIPSARAKWFPCARADHRRRTCLLLNNTNNKKVKSPTTRNLITPPKGNLDLHTVSQIYSTSRCESASNSLVT